MNDAQFGFRTRSRLMEERKKAGGSLPWGDVDRIIQECYDESVKNFTAHHSPPKTKKKALMVGQCDEEWISELENDPTFAGIDIKRELGKCQVWMKLRARPTTRRTFVNWLLKAERTIGYNGTGKTSGASAAIRDPYHAPENWRELAAKAYPSADFSEREWSEIGLSIRSQILKQTQ